MVSQLIEKIKKTNTPICVGLDLMLSYVLGHVVKKSLDTHRETLERTANAIWWFSEEIINHTFDLIPTVEPRIAMYEQFGIEGLTVYKRTVNHCHEKGLIVIGDAKRGGIGSTSIVYAADHLDKVQVGNKSLGGSDMSILTVNPYLGTDGVKPFVNICKSKGKGLFVLVKTSNPPNREFQDHLIDGKPLYEWVAAKMEEWGSDYMDGEYSDVGAVVGATYPEMGKILRKFMPHAYFLVSGYRAQGGTTADLKHCFNQNGLDTVVNSSRGTITAYKQGECKNFGPKHFDEASRQAVINMAADISSVL